MIKISIMSTFCNDREMLKIILDNVLNQTYPNIEHCITDGGSDDGSIELLREYEEKYKQSGKILKWVSEKDKGIYDGINKAFAMATGDYVIFASDPYVNNTVIEFVASVLEKGDYDYVYGGIYFVRDGTVIRRWSGKPGNWRTGWMPADPTLFVKREVWLSHGPYDIRYKSAADYKYHLSLLMDSSLKSCSLGKKLVVFYADGVSNKGFKGKWLSICECQKILREYHVPFALFTNICKTLRGLCAYIFVRRKKFDPEAEF